MSRLMYADVPVAREALNEPGVKLETRRQLLANLRERGHVESIERFILDPPDGPFNDGTLPPLDKDVQALVRVVAYVTPFAVQR